MIRLLTLPIRLPLKISWWTVRLAGLSNAVLLLIGVAIGLLVAPTTGAEMRKRLMERIDERRQAGPGGSAALPVPDASRA